MAVDYITRAYNIVHVSIYMYNVDAFCTSITCTLIINLKKDAMYGGILRRFRIKD